MMPVWGFGSTQSLPKNLNGSEHLLNVMYLCLLHNHKQTLSMHQATFH